jgi:hypothetical protein
MQGLCAMTKEWLRTVVYATFTHDTAPNTLAEYFETPGIVQAIQRLPNYDQQGLEPVAVALAAVQSTRALPLRAGDAGGRVVGDAGGRVVRWWEESGAERTADARAAAARMPLAQVRER